MFSLYLDIDTVYTLTTRADGQKGSYPTPPPTAPFTLPYEDDFEGEHRVLGVVQNCHHFHKSTQQSGTQSTLGGGGQWPACAFKNLDHDALHFHTGWLKVNIFKVLF